MTQYEKGYFNYRKDGFGPVVKTKDEVISFIIKKLDDGIITQILCRLMNLRGL